MIGLNKKAQNATQIFTYVLGIVVVGLILLFGVRGIGGIIANMELAENAKFEKALSSKLQSISGEFGSTTTFDYDISKDYKQICFVRNYDIESVKSTFNNIVNVPAFNQYPAIRAEVKTNYNGLRNPVSYAGMNIFLLKKDNLVVTRFKISAISFADNNILLCKPIYNGKLTFTIEGQGDHSIIS